jgi:hypothetical protein
MADLLSISQVIYDQVFPNATAQTSVKVDHVIEEAKIRYAYEMWLRSKISAREDGGWEVPSSLLREADLEIVNNEADISDLKIFRSFDGDMWVQGIGGFNCECTYMRQSVNLSKMLCDDEYLGNAKPYIAVGTKIKFPKGAHAKTIPIIYASSGEDLGDEIQVDDGIGGLVSDYLWKRFTNRLPEDRTNDSNTNRP